MRADRHISAMGTTGTVVVLATSTRVAEDLASWAERRVAQLERRWSRFLPSSEISRLHAAPRGVPVLVSADTVQLVERAVLGWRVTDGAFDPTVHDALVALGYDRTFAEIPPLVALPFAEPVPFPAPGAAGIEIDPTLGAVVLPHGTSFDPGGVGKGLAADIVAESLVARGATGALVDLGGDIRCCGSGPEDGIWVIEVDAAIGLPRLALRDAGIATSSTRRRRWNTSGGPRHHLVDPATGEPTAGCFDTATAIAPTAWLAEVATKAALVRGRVDVHPAAHVALHGACTVASPILEELRA